MSEGKSFFHTLPGILTGIAAVIGSITTLYLALQGNPAPGESETPHDNSITDNPASENPVTEDPGTDSTTANNFAEQVRGIWTNTNPNTRSITKLVILRKNGTVYVHAWGSCSPTDCDWGETPATVEGDILKVTWDWRGGERDMTIRLAGRRLTTETINTYHDNRPPRRSSESFVKR